MKRPVKQASSDRVLGEVSQPPDVNRNAQLRRDEPTKLEIDEPVG